VLALIVGITAAVLALAAAVRALEPTFAFFPSVGETTTPADFGVPFERVSVRTADRIELHGWFLPHPAPRAEILYFHGNGGNLSVWAPILTGIQRQGYSVRAFDYRGYGLSTGRPTEQGLYRDVDAVIGSMATKPRSGLPLIYWGRSLGATMAAFAATIEKPDALILESGFPDVKTVIRTSPVLAVAGMFSSYRFATAEFLESVRVPVPVLVMHGDRDSVIPFSAGRALFDRIPGPKQFVTIAGGDHNDLEPADASAYWQAVETLLSKIRSDLG
jgi:fermentation-respiration switch protein FrsA (DUF1100 family)